MDEVRGPGSPFFAERPPDRPGLAVYLTAGDPPPPVLADLLLMLDARRVDCVELAVPFPDSVSDGPVLRRSARRALTAGTDLVGTLRFVRQIRPQLRHLRIALLADWRHTVRPVGEDEFARRARDSGADGVLVHAVAPRYRAGHLDATTRAGLPAVATCYASSPPATRMAAAQDATAYVYLVANYGRSGTAPAEGYAQLAGVIDQLRTAAGARAARAPVAVGFGVRGRADVDLLAQAGAEAVIVGSAAVSIVERAIDTGCDPVAALDELIGELRGP